MSEKMTTDKAVARVMELILVNPDLYVQYDPKQEPLRDHELRREFRKILGDLYSAGWSEGYNEGMRDL